MKNLEDYIKEIEDYYFSLKDSFGVLTPKENQIILKWYENNLDINLIKKLIRSEIVKLPKNKRKKFSLIAVDNQLKEKIKVKPEEKKENKPYKKNKWEIIIEKLKLPEELLNIPKNYKGDKSLYLERKVISYIWQKMKKEERQKLVDEAVKELKNDFIINTDKKEAVKSIIYIKIKEDILSKL